MWGSWGFVIFLVAAVIGMFALGGWVLALPLGVLGLAAVWALRVYGRQRGSEEVSWMRDQANTAGPLDKGGIEFTDKDRESLSS